VTLWVATLSDEVLNAAVPLLLSVPVPRVVVPSINVTVPVGVPAPGELAVTLAVNVTDWPKTEGFGAEATLTVKAGLTFWLTALDVLVVKSTSPL
jgi:hypothetical protein